MVGGSSSVRVMQTIPVKSNTQEKLAATSCTINLQLPNSFSSVAGMKPRDGDGRRKITFPGIIHYNHNNRRF